MSNMTPHISEEQSQVFEASRPFLPPMAMKLIGGVVIAFSPVSCTSGTETTASGTHKGGDNEASQTSSGMLVPSLADPFGPDQSIRCVAGQSFRGDQVILGDFNGQVRNALSGSGVRGYDYSADISTEDLTALTKMEKTLPKNQHTYGNSVLQWAEGMADIAALPTSTEMTAAAATKARTRGKKLKDKSVRSLYDGAIDSALADAAEVPGPYTAEDLHKEKLLTAVIKNEKLKKEANAFLNAEYAVNVMYDESKVSADIAKDKEVNKLLSTVRRASAQIDDRNNVTEAYSTYVDASGELQRLMNERQNTLDADMTSPTDITANMKSKIYDKLDDSSDQQIAVTKAHNKSVSLPAHVAKLDTNMGHNPTLDLSHVVGDKICVETPTSDAADGDTDAYTIRSFASVSLVGGKPVFRIANSARTQLSKADQATLESIVAKTMPYIETAFANGEVNTINFAVTDADQNEGPFYTSASDEVYMLMAQSEAVSADEMHSALVHELSHSLTKQAIDANELDTSTEKARQQYFDACTVVHGIDAVATTKALENKQLLKKLMSHTTPAIKPVLKAFLDGNVKGKPLEKIIDEYNELTSCRNPSYLDAFNAVIFELDLYDKVSTDDIESYYAGQKSLKSTYDTYTTGWGVALNKGLFANTFDEHNYVQTESSHKPLIGHSGDNPDEAMATLLDDAINYTTPFAQKLRGAATATRRAELKMVDATLAFVSHLHPNLAAMYTSLKQRIHAIAGN